MTDRRRDDKADKIGIEAELESELNQFADEWKAIRISFVGGSPDDLESVAAWDDFVVRNLIIKSTQDRDFASAWHLAVSDARNLLYSRLVPWSCKLLSTYGIPVLSGIPNPPTNVLPVHASLEDLTLTPDLVDAGTRVVVWSAASTSPGTLCRSSDHQVYFWLWTGRLLKWHDGELFPDRVIVDALQALLRSLKSAKPTHVTTATAQNIALNRETPVIRNSIRRLNVNTFQIVFGTDTSEIQGAGAQRFVELCRWKRVSPKSLVVDTAAVRASGSVDVERTGGLQQIAKIQRQVEEMSPRQRMRFKRETENRHQDIEARLATSLPEHERDKLEKELKTNRFYRNELNRKDATSPSDCREIAKLSLKRLAQQQRSKGRLLLAKFLETCIIFDKANYEFEYTGPDWEFLGF